MINLHVEPRVVKSWEQFLKENHKFSVALDGYVRGKPRFDSSGPRINYNHHEDVDRLCTRSTCGQVYIGIKQGLLDIFRQDGEPYAEVYVNDADQDTCASIWLLQNNERIMRQKSEPLITRLVSVTDFLDTTAGAYPISPDTSVRMELAWIFQPYTSERMHGRIQHMQEAEMRNVIESVCNRISQYTLGRGKKIKLETDYEILGGGRNWELIKETGFDARSMLFSMGINAFVSVRENGNDTYTYSIGKISPYIDFPILDLYSALSEAEGFKDENDCWGGSDIIGGSPRKSGSRLKPKELERIINEFLEK